MIFKKEFDLKTEICADTYAEINLKTLKNNLDFIKKSVSSSKHEKIKICSVIKADAYGHGMNETGKFLSESGTDYLATADYDESLILSEYLRDYYKKKSSKKVPVLCLGILNDRNTAEKVIQKNIEVSVADIKSAEMLNAVAKNANAKVTIQIQVDSGINRTGFKLNEVSEAMIKILSLKNLKPKGIYSHFATSEIPGNAYSKKQLREFKELVMQTEQNIFKFELRHICNTGGILNFFDPYFNMIRPGISLYGYYPDRKKTVKDIGIKPVMTLKSRVKFIKTLEKNKSVSYGRKYFTKKKTNIISVPIGYGDGYSRLLTNKGGLIINGKLYKVSGTVCMDWIMADVGINSGIKTGDEVILFGKEYPADNLSDIIKTIPYEIICGITKRVNRIYI